MPMTPEENVTANLSCIFTVCMQLMLSENGEKHTLLLTLHSNA